MLHVPSMEGLDGCGRRAHTLDDPAFDDRDLPLLMMLSVLDATGCLQPLRDNDLPARRDGADLHFAFVFDFLARRFSGSLTAQRDGQPATPSARFQATVRECASACEGDEACNVMLQCSLENAAGQARPRATCNAGLDRRSEHEFRSRLTLALSGGGRTTPHLALGHRAATHCCSPVRCSGLILIEAPSPADHRGMLRAAKPLVTNKEETSMRFYRARR